MDSGRNRPQKDGRAARWTGQHQRRRDQFVTAALAAIAEDGPEVSTQRIADHAGVARTRLYKHFDGAVDLQRAIAGRVVESIFAELEPVWHPSGSPRQMITAAVGAYLRWLVEHTNLYRYLLRLPSGQATSGWHGSKAALGGHLTELFAGYLRAFDLDQRPAQTLAFGLVGYVESATTRWLDNPDGVGAEQLVDQLAAAAWAVLDRTLRDGGVELDPDRWLPLPDDLPTGSWQRGRDVTVASG